MRLKKLKINENKKDMKKAQNLMIHYQKLPMDLQHLPPPQVKVKKHMMMQI